VQLWSQPRTQVGKQYPASPVFNGLDRHLPRLLDPRGLKQLAPCFHFSRWVV
jgi:hypothetical protein